MIKSNIVHKTTTVIYEITTDDIEKMLIKGLNLTGDTQFNWNIGQWVDLTIKQTITVELNDE